MTTKANKTTEAKKKTTQKNDAVASSGNAVVEDNTPAETNPLDSGNSADADPGASNNGFSPFEEPTVLNEYTISPVLDPDKSPIPEPVFTPPSVQQMQRNFDIEQSEIEHGGSLSSSANIGASPTPPGNPGPGTQTVVDNKRPNPGLNPLAEKDQAAAVNNAVEGALDAYSWLNSKAARFAMIPEKKIQSMMIKGELHPEQGIPLAEGVVSIMDYARSWNKEAEEAVEVSETFKKDVRPYMRRVFAKYNLAMKDEHMLMYHFGKDIVGRLTILREMRKASASILDTLKKQNISNMAAVTERVASAVASEMSKQSEQPNAETGQTNNAQDNLQESESGQTSENPSSGRSFHEPGETGDIKVTPHTEVKTTRAKPQNTGPGQKSAASRTINKARMKPDVELGDTTILANLNPKAGKGKKTPGKK
jgi:hypothetical protein